uniref:Uncharacterized protein n=1 Tax=Physcomitrium patens TaxID=3218 RepID=A0A2K1KFK0_PHYPA|nr:hypothetical protein PHYPA_008934 [Physcomitrium patens]
MQAPCLWSWGKTLRICWVSFRPCGPGALFAGAQLLAVLYFASGGDQRTSS